MKVTETKLTEIKVARTIPASAEEVFDVWLDPKSSGGPWFGAGRVILNPAVDGLLLFRGHARGAKVATLRTLPPHRSPLQCRVQVGIRSNERPRVGGSHYVRAARERHGSDSPPYRRARRRNGTPASGWVDLDFVNARRAVRFARVGCGVDSKIGPRPLHEP
jgi:hypothetical protein